MTTTATAPAVGRTSNQQSQTQPVSHRVRNLLIAGAVVVAAAIALLIWALMPASSSSSRSNPTAPGHVQHMGVGDVCVVAPGTNFC